MATEGKNSSRSRVAIALLCGLAMACAVMYITADGAEAVEQAKEEDAVALSNKLQHIESYDVKKAGVIYTPTPRSGRERLLSYFNFIEKKIATEVAGRRADIASIRAKMAKNRAYNAKARSQMKKMLLHKMAVNAKKAKDELDAAMRRTAETFFKAEKKNNERNAATLKRSAKTREIMRKNKREAAKNLSDATSAQQRALSALDAQTNARIAQTNKHIAANAAQIKINAKKARDALSKACHRFDKKMFHANEEAKKGRSKLAADAATQDKRFRAMVGGKIKAISASTAAQFSRVRATMAKDRHHADMMLKQATTKMAAAMNAQKVLQDKRYAKTVADIAAAKAEAKALVAKATTYFKVNLLHLASTVKHQVTKLNGRVTQLQGVVTKNKLAQADVNRHVAAEMKRMVKLGNHRESVLAKNDSAMRSLMAKNKAASSARMLKMANAFNAQLGKIRKQMKKDRAHAEHALSKSTDKLYNTLKTMAKIQAAKNKQITSATRRARLDAEDALRAAKSGFSKKLAKLHATVVKNDAKANKKIEHLTGIEAANAAKSAKGREMLTMMAKANKNELKTAIRTMVHKGEMRALQIEKAAKKENKKTLAALNMKITTQIGALTKKTHASIEDLQLATKGARAAMKREILYAVRSAAAVAKTNLKTMVTNANKQFANLHGNLSKAAAKAAAARGTLKAQIAQQKKLATRAIKDAVANQNRALLALKEENDVKLKKTNLRVDAYAKAIENNAKAVDAQMKANIKALLSKIAAAKKAAAKGAAKFSKASVARHQYALKKISQALRTARTENNKKFGKVYTTMAKTRGAMDNALMGATIELQKSIAKRSALYDARFSKTVTNMKLARKQAFLQVQQAKKSFTTQITAVTAAIKDQETRVSGDIAVVTAMVASNKAQQIRINRRVNAEMGRIVKLAAGRHASARKWRGGFRHVVARMKAVAVKEVQVLKKRTKHDLAKIRSHAATLRRQAARDLSKSTSALYGALSEAQLRQNKKFAGLKGNLKNAQAASSAAIKRCKADFLARLTTATDTVTSNNLKFERGLQRITKVAHSWKYAAGKDRKLLQTQINSMEQDMNKALIRAIQIGESKAKAMEQRMHANIGASQQALMGEIAQRVEVMADKVFKAVKTNRGKIADNYLALKAYCGAAAGKIIDYTTRSRGRGLSSVGDFMQTVASLSVVKSKPAEGLGAGGKQVLPLFGGSPMKVSADWTKTNALVNEYTRALTLTRQRWPYGLGHYLLGKVQASMQSSGLLSITKVSDKAGMFVRINGHAIGLSNKLSDFDQLSVRVAQYQNKLRQLTSKLPKLKKKKSKKYYVKPPEYQGN